MEHLRLTQTLRQRISTPQRSRFIKTPEKDVAVRIEPAPLRSKGGHLSTQPPLGLPLLLMRGLLSVLKTFIESVFSDFF